MEKYYLVHGPDIDLNPRRHSKKPPRSEKRNRLKRTKEREKEEKKKNQKEKKFTLLCIFSPYIHLKYITYHYFFTLHFHTFP